MQKNTAGQKWYVFAFDRTTSSPVTGDALNITAKVSIDYGAATALGDLNPAEVEDGYYMFDLTQAETNGDHIAILPESTTPNVVVIGAPATQQTVPNQFSDGVIQTGDSFARIGASGAGLTVLASAVDLATVDTNVDSILLDTGTSIPAQISGVDSKVTIVDANVDAVLVDTGTTLPASIATIDTNVSSILVDTGTTLPATLTTIEGKVDTVDAVADLIKIDTTAILADTGTDGVVISTAQAQSLADEILKRSVATGEATAAEHSLATIILAILESSRSTTTWTIKRTDGVTTHATKTLTLDANADPVTGIQ